MCSNNCPMTVVEDFEPVAPVYFTGMLVRVAAQLALEGRGRFDQGGQGGAGITCGSWGIGNVAHVWARRNLGSSGHKSGHVPSLNEDKVLPEIGTPPPLLREHRLYQADWLLQFHGFRRKIIVL